MTLPLYNWRIVYGKNIKIKYKRRNRRKLDWVIESSDWDMINKQLQNKLEGWLDNIVVEVLGHRYELAKQNFYSTYENNEACQNTDSAIMEFMFAIHEKEIGCLIIYSDILVVRLQFVK